MGERRSFPASAGAALRSTARRCHENCVGGGMHSPLHQQLMHEIYTIITLARPVVEAIERRDRDLGTQVRRALNSIALNMAEGLGCRAGHARNRFETAHGSLFEVRASVGVAQAWQYVSENDCTELIEHMHVLGGRLYGMMRR